MGKGESKKGKKVRVKDAKDEYFFLKGKVMRDYNNRKYKVKIFRRNDSKVYREKQLDFLN